MIFVQYEHDERLDSTILRELATGLIQEGLERSERILPACEDAIAVGSR